MGGPTASDDAFELLRADVEAHVERRVCEAVGGLIQRAAALRGVAKALEAAGDLGTDADPESLTEAAACIRALATEAVTSATVCIGISERLRAYASIRGLVAAAPAAGVLVPGPADPVDVGGHGAPPAATVRPRRRRTHANR